jgi:hypothetical protein
VVAVSADAAVDGFVTAGRLSDSFDVFSRFSITKAAKKLIAVKKEVH